jgi:hypothetical protein
VELNKALFLGSMVGLIALNLVALNLFAGIIATALAAIVIARFNDFTTKRPQFYAFILAEVSALSLYSSLLTAVLYQVLCVLLLSTMFSPLTHVNALATYKRPLFLLFLVAAASIAPAAAVVYSKALSYTTNQVLALVGLVLLIALGGWLVAAQRQMGPFRTAER